MRINKELMKGSTSILVLSLLSREDMYGYMIVQRLKAGSENVFEMKEGTLYPMLHALENEGAVEAYWDEGESGKKRKYYRITQRGRNVLEEKKQEWREYSRAVDKVIGLATIGGGAYAW
ncbi:MAG: helix-turn-helix transcriptional regulator [Oscillospiraceae bacterium]|nr:helix-turn-helix transcriptional regulator [Oscillospiraceae bacterium]